MKTGQCEESTLHAPIILLDEATASLDVENETAIQEALSRLIKNKTVLIIAHRMRTVAGADGPPPAATSAAGGRFFPDAGKAGVQPFYGWVSTSGSPGL